MEKNIDDEWITSFELKTKLKMEDILLEEDNVKINRVLGVTRSFSSKKKN